MRQQLARNAVASQHAAGDRVRDRRLQIGRVVADPQIPRRALVKVVDDLALLAAAKLSLLPPTERFCDGEQSQP